MNKILTWIIVIVIVIVGGYYLLFRDKSGVSDETGPIKIGFMGSLTGDAASYGEPQRDALKLAVEDINKSGGVNGRLIEVIYEDGKCNGKDGANAAQKLINVDKVKVILGGSCSSETLAAVPIAEKEKVVIVTGSATSPDLINKSKFFFRVYPNDSVQGRILAEGAYNIKGWKKVAVVQEQTDYALGVYKIFAAKFEELGGKLVREEFPSTITDFRSVLTKLRGEKPDALLVSVQTAAMGERVFKQLRDLNWKPALIVNDVIGGDVPTVTNNKDILEGALAADFLLDENNEKLKKLTETFKITYNSDIRYPTYTSAVYDSLYLIVEAIKAVGYDGEKIAEWARTSLKDFPGASGLITVGSDGERVGGHVLKIVKNGKVEILQ